MGVTETARLGLVKPDDDESADIDVINSNMDIIDGAIGPSIVGTVAEIAEPYNGQIARELDNDRTLMFINGVWLFVAVGDANSDNPNRIRLPNNALNDIDDTTNAFQIGPDSGDNLAFDQDKVQSRDNEAADTLYLNPYGGAVEIGESPGLTIQKAGIKSDEMQSEEDNDLTNTSIAATSYATGSPNVEATVQAPPSGRILVIIATKMKITAFSGGEGVVNVTYEGKKMESGSPTGPGVPSPGGDGNTITGRTVAAAEQLELTTSLVDMVKGLNPGDNYRFQMQHKKDAGSTTANLDFRKIIAIPMI